MRGVQNTSQNLHFGDGITPACAGSTCGSVSLSSVATDHPRVCGEYYSLIKSEGVIQGSPPRVRGVPTRPRIHELRDRITPACAGSTWVRSFPPDGRRDHPRVCGEYRICLGGGGEEGGSPPRVRGVRRHAVGLTAQHGITPACAGSTDSCVRRMSFMWDHPRVCGEYPGMSLNDVAEMGSPPRVRGVPGGVDDNRRQCGITPACAGSTDVRLARPPSPGDHPRVCGEYIFAKNC